MGINENLLDQFFLIDRQVIADLITAANLSKEDKVLEIGAGKGVITNQIVSKAGSVIVIEIDNSFKADLETINGKVRVIINDALKVIKDCRELRLNFNKIIGSLPSSIVEPLMPLLTKVNFQTAVFLVPLKYVDKLISNPAFSSYWEIEVVRKISRKSFSPIPKTNWALIKLSKRTDAPKEKNEKRFLTQYVYEHQEAKKENALREGLIKFYKSQGKKLTKNEARRLIATKNPPSGGF